MFRNERNHSRVLAGSGFECRNGLRKRRSRRGPSWSILALRRVPRFGRPRHEFAIQANPVRIELLPNTGRAEGGVHPGEKFKLYGLI